MGSSEQKNVLLAFVLSAGVLFAWQSYFAPKPVVKTETGITTSQTTAVNPATTSQAVVSNPTATQMVANTTAITNTTTTRESKTYTLTNGEFSVEIKDDLTFLNIENPDVKLTYLETVSREQALQLQVRMATGFQPLQFDLTQQSPNTLVGTNAATGAQATIALDEIGKANISLTSPANLTYRFVMASEAKELENRKFREFTFYKNSSFENISVGDEESGEGSFDWTAIDFNYHLLAITLPAKTIGKYQTSEAGVLNFDLVNPTRALDYNVVFAKKNYDTLKMYGHKLEQSVDFGFFAILAVPILRGLQFFYNSIIPNYGIAIILLTLVIRLITFPLQFKSFKSMKQMQKIQPDLAKLKEKYKDDPQRMQRETMELFKKAGANPLGGCLPMVLQMPVFFAFYQVLYNAYELVQAPFYFWVHDLSVKDPYYVLPVLMGIAMFGQTKLNPSASADPTQKKMMLFMPLIFTFIMKDLPAGLNLYIFVSTLFGIAQQLLVYRVVK